MAFGISFFHPLTEFLQIHSILPCVPKRRLW
jgi:hypothetical protein